MVLLPVNLIHKMCSVAVQSFRGRRRVERGHWVHVIVGHLHPVSPLTWIFMKTPKCWVKSPMTRGDKPRDIFHLRGRNFTVPACQKPRDTQTHTGLNHPPHLQEGGLVEDAAKPFIMFSPETAVVPTDLTPGRRVYHQPSRPI